MSSTEGSLPGSLPPTVAGRLRATAARVGGDEALRWHDRTVTWAELDARVDGAAAGLAGLGVQPGDRVALVLSNTPTFVEAWYAVQRLGAVAVPAATELAPDELRHVLADSGARAAVVAASLTDTISGLHDELPELTLLVTEGGADDDAPAVADTTWEAVVAGTAGDGEVLPDEDRDTEALAALLYTSGTTGRPRGAMLTVRNLVANQDQSLASRMRVEPDDVVLCVLPLFHVYALNVVLQERFDPATTADLVAEHGVTVVPGAPPMYVAWGQQPPGDRFASVRLCVSGAAPLAPATARRFTEVTGLEIDEGYGLTEASPVVTSTAVDAEPVLGSVGRPLPGVELRLVADDEDVEPGDTGEVWVRGPNVFAGYWQDEEATARALTEDGWLRTGDVGVLDDDGRLRIVDRRTDLVLVSGFNVYPREVERVLRTHPAVAQAAVVGMPHPVTGETPVAYVVRAGDATVVEDDLHSYCLQHLARYKCPSSYRVVRELPLTVTGKVRRTELRMD